MILCWMLAILIAGGLIAWPLARVHSVLSRLIALSAVTLDLALALFLAVRDFGSGSIVGGGWREEMIGVGFLSSVFIFILGWMG